MNNKALRKVQAKKDRLLALRIAHTFNTLTLVHQAVLRAEML